MKKTIYGLLGFTALSLVSCDYNNPNDGKFGNDPQVGYVTFENENESYIGFDPAVETNFETSVAVVIGNGLENLVDDGDPRTPPDVSNTPVNEDGLTVYYTVEDLSGSSAFITKSGSVNVPKGALSANIPFTIPANAQGADCTDFRITITSTSRENVTVGVQGDWAADSGVLTHIVHVGPAYRDALIGTYDVVKTEGGVITEYDVTISAGEAANEIIISNIYTAASSSSTIAYIDNVGQITYPLNFLDNFLFNAGGIGDVYVEGIGGVAYCNTVNIDFVVVNESGEPVTNDVNLVMTKQ